MSGKKLQEELHNPQIPKDDPEKFSLEDILREFGVPARPNQAEPKASKPEPLVQETPKLSRATPSVAQTASDGVPTSESKPLQKQPPGTEEKQTPSREQTEIEKQIYQHLDMVQTGFAGRRVRLVICFLLSTLAAALTIARQLLPSGTLGNADLLNLGELGLLILCALLSLDVFFSKKDGFAGVGFGYRLLMLYELILSIFCGFLLLADGQNVICAPVCLTLSFSLLGVQVRAKGSVHTLEASQNCTQGDTLFFEPDFENRKPGILPGRGSKAVLLRGNAVTPAVQRAISLYALLVIVVSLATAVLLPQDNLEDLLKNALVTALMGTPLCALLTWFRPWFILARRLHHRGAALCGCRGVRLAARSVAVPLSDDDLFSSELMRLNGVKFFGGADPDKVVTYAASLMNLAGGCLKEIFSRQAELRDRKLYPVDRFRRYDSGGVSGEIWEDSVLVGTMRFLQAMGVALPSGTKVNQAVYVAINGNLAGVFAFNYGISPQGAEAMSCLASYSRAMPIITAVDFMVTDSFLRSKYQIHTEGFSFPLLSQKAQLLKRKPSEAGTPCVIYGGDRLPVTALTLKGSRALRSASRWGAMLTILGGVLGLSVALMLLLGQGVMMSAASILLYQFLWLIPGWIISGWTKYV